MFDVMISRRVIDLFEAWFDIYAEAEALPC